jgi:hypothetical protein
MNAYQRYIVKLKRAKKPRKVFVIEMPGVEGNIVDYKNRRFK